mmetsp:Transcript_22257/g.56985  ORF Transcript_22257/g.56985 Transcript_22257/m.56985 type:complete len:212 (-) Transcript_22257:456-1091(-)
MLVASDVGDGTCTELERDVFHRIASGLRGLERRARHAHDVDAVPIQEVLALDASAPRLVLLLHELGTPEAKFSDQLRQRLQRYLELTQLIAHLLQKEPATLQQLVCHRSVRITRHTLETPQQLIHEERCVLYATLDLERPDPCGDCCLEHPRHEFALRVSGTRGGGGGRRTIAHARALEGTAGDTQDMHVRPTSRILLLDARCAALADPTR